MDKFLKVNLMTNGEIRVEADLFPEEIKHGAIVRGFNADEAIALSVKLFNAAQEAKSRGRG
jgi:hypothetical protein